MQSERTGESAGDHASNFGPQKSCFEKRPIIPKNDMQPRVESRLHERRDGLTGSYSAVE